MLPPASPALLPRHCFPHLLPAFSPPRGALSLPPPPFCLVVQSLLVALGPKVQILNSAP